MEINEVDDKSDSRQIAARTWERYEYGISRGHREYTEVARVLEGFYLGGSYDASGRLKAGGHWTQADLDALEAQGRPAYEINEIKPAVEAAFGYQISNRMDIAFRPRSGDATKDIAEVRSKVAMQIADNNNLHWIETDVFGDGMIQQRGFFDIRIDFDDSTLGEVRVKSLDPMDVMPDPDANSYDPKYWDDVIVTRFMSLDDIEGLYGEEARNIAEEEESGGYTEVEFGDDADGERRNRFGTEDRYDAQHVTGRVTRLRVVDRQYWVRKKMDVAVHPGGDVRPLTGDETPEQIAEMQAEGVTITKKVMRRVRWTVATSCAALHDEWSPYDRFTIVPFFPYFRRGKTRGMVDGAVGPSMVLNKGVSQAIHILNSTANSGWQMEEDQLVNMTPHGLAAHGAKTGLVIERKEGTPRLDKIESNRMPEGLDRLIGMSNKFIQDVTVPDAMRGLVEGQESGVAIQSRQHAAQQILAVPLDNLARTRNLVAGWIDYAIGKYYDSERVFRITRHNPMTGKEEEEVIEINKLDPFSGMYLNDMTAGEYDVVISEQPMQVTFENSQFTQIMEMREKGIMIPDPIVVQHSNLSDKAEIISTMENLAAPPPDPVAEAKAKEIEANTELKLAQIGKTKNEMVNVGVDGIYSAIQSAGVLAQNALVAPLADQMLRSAGFEDQDAPPIVPTGPGGYPDAPGAIPGDPNQMPTDPISAPAPIEPMPHEIPVPNTSGPEGMGAGIKTPELGDGGI